jgi:hypothetical protein
LRTVSKAHRKRNIAAHCRTEKRNVQTGTEVEKKLKENICQVNNNCLRRVSLLQTFSVSTTFIPLVSITSLISHFKMYFLLP